MKYAISLVAGLVVGMLAFAVLMYNNPFSAPQVVSPLAVTDLELMNLRYSAVPAEALFYTNDGESTSRPHPGSAAELWEATVNDTQVLVTGLFSGVGERTGIGVKFTTASEDTRLLNSEALADSAWHIYLPGRGTLFVDQRENYWAYLRDIVVRARMNSADSWRGAWTRVMTTGPNAIGTARAIGGSGDFANAETEAVETLSATAYSAHTGPVAIDGDLTISLPEAPWESAP